MTTSGSKKETLHGKHIDETCCEKDLVIEPRDGNDRKPSRVSQKSWERFQSLQKQADSLAKRSEQKRIKHLKRQVMETVKESLITEEEKHILQHEIDQYGASEKPLTEQCIHGKQREKIGKQDEATKVEYKESIQPYLGINDHLRVAKKGPQSGLEKEIESALASGDIKKAEQLSDKLANRDYAVKITEAADAREFLKRKKEEEEFQKSKKKQKLHWGFEHKQRWETKSNM